MDSQIPEKFAPTETESANQETTQTRPVPKTNKSLIVGLFITTFLLMCSTGYFAYQNFQLKKMQTTTTQATPIPTSSFPSPTTDPTANWQIYQNSSFNFALKYPANWQLEETERIITIKSKSELTEEELENLGVGYTSSSIPVAKLSIELSPAQMAVDISSLRQLTQSTDTLEITEKTETQIQGYPAIQYQGRGTGSLEDQGLSGLNIGTDNGFLRIKLNNYSRSSESQIMLDQILSTFEFTE